MRSYRRRLLTDVDARHKRQLCLTPYDRVAAERREQACFMDWDLACTVPPSAPKNAAYRHRRSRGGYCPFAEAPATTISTRRLLARPSAVSLLATGLDVPLPTAVTLSERSPLLRRKLRTASARSRDNFMLFDCEPTESV